MRAAFTGDAGIARALLGELEDTWPETVVRCDRYLIGAYQRGDDTWPVIDLFDFIESNLFLQATAE